MPTRAPLMVGTGRGRSMGVHMFNAFILRPGVFRFSLAILVFISHVSRVNVGRLGVILFFLLSGYWVAKTYEQKFASSPVQHFYLNRYLRIAPVYLFIVGIAFLVFGGSVTPNMILIGIATNGGDLLGTSWSLDIELQFYAFLPLILGLSNTSQKALIGFAVFGTILGWWAFFAFDIVSFTQYLPAFIAGVKMHKSAASFTRLHVSSGVLLLILMTTVIYASPYEWVLDKTKVTDWQSDMISMVAMILLIPYISQSLSKYSPSWDRHIGNFTYPFYLVHFPIIRLVTDIFGDSLEAKSIAVVGSIVVSWLVYVAVDRPAERLRVYLHRRTSTFPRALP